MSRRIDIELTSQTGDGSWTWRTAGARQPKGVVAAALVPAGEAVGDVLRADVEVGLEGIEILSLAAAKPARSPEKVEGRIEVKGTPKRAPDVSVSWPRARASGRRDDDGERRDRATGRRGRRGDRGPEGGATSEAIGDDRAAAEGRRAPTPRGAPPGEGDGRPARGDRPVAPTSTVHRNAMLAALRPEQLPVAEQLLRGGLQAVRQAIEAQNSAAKADGKPPVAADALFTIAEELLPAVRLADWKDRATVAQTAGKDYRLRELRAVVAASRTVNLDEEGRAMAKALQESLEQRTTALREEWLARITNALNDGRVQEARRGLHPATRARHTVPGRARRPAGRRGRRGHDRGPGARGMDAPARRGRRLAGAPHGEARRHPGRRGGRRRHATRPGGPRAGQAARAAHPAPAAAAGGHRAPLQPNRR